MQHCVYVRVRKNAHYLWDCAKIFGPLRLTFEQVCLSDNALYANDLVKSLAGAQHASNFNVKSSALWPIFPVIEKYDNRGPFLAITILRRLSSDGGFSVFDGGKKAYQAYAHTGQALLYPWACAAPQHLLATDLLD